MAKRKKSREKKNSSGKKDENSNAFFTDNYKPEIYEAQIKTLRKKIKNYEYLIDNLKDFILQVTFKVHSSDSDIVVLTTYLRNCIDNKDKDIDVLKQTLVSLNGKMSEKQKEHNKIVVTLRLEIEAIEERLNSEKAVLTGKVESLENFSVERVQLQSKTVEIENLIEETAKSNKFKFHEKDLELTVSQDQLFKEMLSRISHLAEKFRIGTEKRINKTERRTLEYSYILNEKLSNLSNKILDIMGKNKSYKQATNQLKHDINVLQDISDQMHKDSSDRLQSLKVSISNCLEKEQKLSSLMESLTISKNIDLLNNDLFDEQIKCINLKESKLTEDLQTLRNKYEHALFQYEEYMNMNNKQVNRLKQLIQARNHLCQLVCDCKTALWEAYEMLETEYATKLSLTERIQRQDHLLTAFFILLYTCDQLVSRITPYEIGDFRLNYITSSIPSASIKQSSRGNNVMYSDSGHTFSSTPLAKSDIQTRKSSENNESNGMIRDLFENDHNLISDFPLASEFGLEPVDSTKQNSFTVNLLKELSKYSRRSGRRTNTPILRSVAVQTELFMSREQSPNSYKQKKLDKLCFIRSNRGVLQLPMLNTTVLAPKEDYDSLYRFNIKPTIRDKSPLLPSLHKLAKM